MEKLTFQEEEIMLIIWRLKEGVVKDFLLQMQARYLCLFLDFHVPMP